MERIVTIPTGGIGNALAAYTIGFGATAPEFRASRVQSKPLSTGVSRFRRSARSKS
jgi:hypothetical protein